MTTPAKRKALRPKTPGPIEEAIVNWTLRGYTPKQIQEELRPIVRKRRAWKMPHLRTIQRIAARAKPPDPTAPWRVEDSLPGDAREVLDVLAELMTETQGRVSQVTRREAEWIVRIRHLGPPLDALQTLHIARLYGSRREEGKSTADLDAFLTFAPWRGEAELATYLAAMGEDGWLQPSGEIGYLWAGALFANGAPPEVRQANPDDRAAWAWRLAAEELRRRFNEVMQEGDDDTQSSQ